MSGPVPSPSMKGRMGRSGTSRRPSGRALIRSPGGTGRIEDGGIGSSNKKTPGGARLTSVRADRVQQQADDETHEIGAVLVAQLLRQCQEEHAERVQRDRKRDEQVARGSTAERRDHHTAEQEVEVQRRSPEEP